jgi:hypothetical protein
MSGSSLGALACQGRQQALYLELTALLIEREITKLSRGEQTALVSFHNVALLARNASEVLTRLARAVAPSDPALAPTCSGAARTPAGDEDVPSIRQIPEL